MATKNTVRRSVSIPSTLARKVSALAKHKRQSTSKVLAELIERGIDSQEEERSKFLELTDRLIATKDARERELLKQELARLTFGP